MKWIQRKAKEKPNSSDSPVDQIAKIRGVENTERFLKPTSEELHDPYLLKNIEEASNRIIKAIMNKENIVISYDCDADGLTSSTIMMRYLFNYTENVDFIYGERNDGHGITEQILITEDIEEERLNRSISNREKIEDADLLILIDSSTNDPETCKKIIKAGTDIVILDHHAIEKENPYCIMVNPQQEDCLYPNKFLSGAGVVFKVLQVIEDTLDEVDVWQFIDLVAVGMYADMMRVDVLENRYLIMHGLRNITNTGLVRILKGGKVDLYNVDCSAIGFTIAPLINGVARMGEIKLAIDILLEDDDKICKKLRLKMDKLNKTRKARQKEIFEQYSNAINEDEKVLIVMDDKSSKGFNGLVAQQLTDNYRRPAIVGRLHKGYLSGSFRSYNNFNFLDFLKGFENDIEVIGHKGAGGFVLAEEHIENLKTYIDRLMPTLTEKEPFALYDLELDVSEINEYMKAIQQFNLVCGSGFPKIIVKVTGIRVNDTAVLGETRETVKITTFNNLELIRFRVDEEYASDLAPFDDLEAVGELKLNQWFNFKTKKKVVIPQVVLQDYALI
ncbi:DHH family phosphoesterase [Halobacillus rhizosphaerae]|uniref:single-stranded-DNA-specific exonuclease RecJ n=1 Tax=Halobacillus rhizosphaerae TaxID=3064889 RepID=UPI00398BA129